MIENILLKSERAIVTPDSISMVYEALSAKCIVGVCKLQPKCTKSRVVKNINFLFQEKYISDAMHLPKEIKCRTSTLPNQAEVCAKKLISKYLK